MKPIKLFFLGNSNTVTPIGSYPDQRSLSKNILKELNQIFELYCKANIKQYDIRSKVPGKEGYYFFMISSTNVFYLIHADQSLQDRDAFALIDEVQKENIYLMVDNSSQRLNSVGNNHLKQTIESYITNVISRSHLNQINIELKETKEIMQDNIKAMTVNLEDAKDLEDKSNKIKEGADIFQKEAGKVKRATWWQNCKWLIILIIVIVLLLVIILPISFSVGKKDDKDKKKEKRFLFEQS
jgi:hypothetical protein